MSRERFHKVLTEVGLEVPKFERVVGLTALRDHLRGETDKYIKISRFRGSLETFHWRSWDDDAPILDCWSIRFGGVADLIPFLVFDVIDTDLEIGGDTYCIDGKFPTHVLDGTEFKDKGYFAAFKPIAEMPDQTMAVLDAFGPVLKRSGHKNFWSMEIRVARDKFFFIDATPRAPLPGMGSQMEIYSNLAEIILSGAQGELVDPVPNGKFAAECILTMKGEKEMWGSLVVPPELKRWMKLGGACQVGDRTWFPPDESHGQEIGWLVAIGDTPKQTIDVMKDHVTHLPEGVSAATESLVDIIKEIESAEDQGIVMTPEPMPEPAAIVE